MAIPEIAVFEQFLRGASVVDRLPSGPHVRFPTTSDHGALYLAYPAGEITIDSVLRRIGEELGSNGCSTDPEIALAVLGNLVDTLSEGAPSAVTHANTCLSTTHDVKLQQHVVRPDTCRPGYEMVVKEFAIRPFNASKLLYWADRGNVTYPYDLNKLAGNTALERERFEMRLVHWDKINQGCSRNSARTHGPARSLAIEDAYYAAVSHHHISQIPQLIASRLLVFEGGGLLRFDAKAFLYGLLSQHIGLFQWVFNGKQRCWAVYSSVSILYQNLLPPQLLPTCQQWLEAETGFRQLDPGKPLDRTIESFCVFLRRAHDHRLARQYDEALLHFVVALELLFNDPENATDSVATRAAVVVHRPLGRTFQEQGKVLKKAYGARSMYVHKGESAPRECVGEAEKAATQVLWALLTVSARGDLRNLDNWLERIDRIAGALKFEFSLPEDEFLAAGMCAVNQPRVSPNRILEDAEIPLPEHLTGVRLVR